MSPWCLANSIITYKEMLGQEFILEPRNVSSTFHLSAGIEQKQWGTFEFFCKNYGDSEHLQKAIDIVQYTPTTFNII